MIGVFSASLFTQKHSATYTGQALVEPRNAINQQNTYLLLGTDNLNQSVPLLRTIHVLFLAASDQAILKVMQIYPSSNSANDALLASQFEIFPMQEVNPKFIDLLGSIYDFDWDGYLIFDQQSLNAYFAWLADQSVGVEKPIDVNSNLANVELLFETLCNILQVRPRSVILDFPFSTISGNHLISNISLKSFSDSVLWLDPALSLTSCEIIGRE